MKRQQDLDFLRYVLFLIMGVGLTMGLASTPGLAQATPSSAPNWLTWLMDAGESAAILGGTWLAERLLRRLWQRLLPIVLKLVAEPQRPWLELVWSFWGAAGRWLLWLGAVMLLIWQVSFFAPAQNWLDDLWRLIVRAAQYVLFLPLFRLGQEQINLTKLFLFLAVSLGIFLFSRGFSAWLKHKVLSRLRIERGSQEAIAGVSGYFLAALGMVIMLQTAGIDLSSLAVVAGVLGIGVGFGLQLLASNFISGVAILLEQPIHVGDFIEVDGMLGTVEKISIRSTTIRTNDNLVVIIPNNRFLEKSVVNRSYRGGDNRLHIPVAVAIGSDLVLVTEALLAAARQDARVLSTPAPTVWLKQFNDWSYGLELLVWINQPQNFEPIRSALNFLIEQELNRHQIEIPLPQQELRLRHPQELLQLLQSFRQADQALTPVSLEPSHPVTQTLRDLLRQVLYFQNLSDAEIRVLIEQGYQKIFPAQSLIFQEQDPGDCFYLILAGQVEVRSRQIAQPLAILSKGDFFGEISLLTGMPRTATVQTVTETTLFIVDQPALQKLLQTQTALAEQIALQLAQRKNVLQELGLLRQTGDEVTTEVPLIWIRQRLQALFGI